MRPKVVTLKSSDGEMFEVEETVAMQSRLIKLMIKEQNGRINDNNIDNALIFLPKVTGKILSKIVHYMKEKLKHADQKELQDLEVDEETLYDLILASSDLGINCLFDLTCGAGYEIMLKEMSSEDLIKGKDEEGSGEITPRDSKQAAQQLIRHWSRIREPEMRHKIRIHIVVKRVVDMFKTAGEHQKGS